MADRLGASSNAYWDGVADRVAGYYLIPKLAVYKNLEYTDLLEQWGVGRWNRALITDQYEAACGNTGICGYFGRAPGDVVGMDISPRLCAKAKGHLADDAVPVGVLSGDATAMPITDDSMDVVFSPSTFDHFPQIDKALEECHRVLKPGGRLVLALNSGNNPFFKLGVRLSQRMKKNEYRTDHFYTVRQSMALLEKAGFAVGRRAAIMHVPIGLTTVIELFDKANNPACDRFTDALISVCRGWGRLNTGLRFLTGWWVVVEGIKANGRKLQQR